jgi:hypothetical protein
MIFGDTKDFAIEAYHEPSGPEWGGCGRLQRTGASRFAQRQIERQRRLAPVADLRVGSR